MPMSKILSYGTEIVSIIFTVYLFCYYFDIFFRRKQKRSSLIVGLAILAAWQIWMLNIHILPAYMNISITIIVTLLAVTVAYESGLWSKCVFTIAFNAIWMLVETLSDYILIIYCEQYASSQLVGSLISKLLLLIIIMALKKVFSDDDIRELPIRYNIMLILILIGSIYIMNYIFMLSYNTNYSFVNFHSMINVVILLGMNVLMFYIYIKLADDLQLRRMTSVYKQQLELCERHQQEREMSTLQLRDVRHNMKNNLVSILAYAESRECGKIVRFVNEVMEEGGMKTSTITNSGNIVVDSLIGYWFMAAQKAGIDFSVNVCISMNIPFIGVDICLILGNLLENAVEAAQKVDGERYIKVQVKYDKKNLLLVVANNYSGSLLKSKDKKLKSTKIDAENHGVGLPSVYRTAAKYNGAVVVDDSVPGRFLIRVVLYGE